MKTLKLILDPNRNFSSLFFAGCVINIVTVNDPALLSLR